MDLVLQKASGPEGEPGGSSRRGANLDVLDLSFKVAPETNPPSNKVGETVGAMIERLPRIAGDLETTQAMLRQLVSQALVRRNVPDAVVSWPKMNIAVPAIEALRYSDLPEQFANLIASSMDARTADAVLPAYVEVLKQLSQDEIELLKNTPDLGRFAPIVDIVFVFPNDQLLSGYRNILATTMAKACKLPRNIPQYIDNLCRLNLINRPSGQTADDASYKVMLRQPFVKDILKTAPAKSSPGYDKAVIGLTDFGDQFRRACLG
jgi:hypothetical protein